MRSELLPIALAASLILATLPACKERGASSAHPLSGSKWEGQMTFRNVDYAFKLSFDEVGRNGALEGEIVWDYFGMRSRVSGRADGNHLVFVDSDRDTKDVVVTGTQMKGTDKNGSATFVARRVDVVEAQPAQLEVEPSQQQQQQQQPAQQQPWQGQQRPQQ